MKKVIPIFLFLTLLSCTEPVPQQADYIGVYRVIKVVEKGNSIKTPTLNHIELTEDFYISRMDRDGDNKFSPDEISRSTYLFDVHENLEAYIQVTGNDSPVTLLPDKYYDLLFKRVDSVGRVTTLYLRKIR